VRLHLDEPTEPTLSQFLIVVYSALICFYIFFFFIISACLYFNNLTLALSIYFHYVNLPNALIINKRNERVEDLRDLISTSSGGCNIGGLLGDSEDLD